MSFRPRFLTILLLASTFFICASNVFSGEKKGVGGLESEPPPWTEFSNVLTNPGFEMGSASGWIFGSGASVTNERPFSGTYSLRCQDSFGLSYQSPLKLNAVGYKIRGKVFPAEGATGKVVVGIFNTSRGTTAMGSFVIEVGVNASVNKWNDFGSIDGSYMLRGLSGDNFQLRIWRSNSTGVFYFDDLELVPLVPLVRTFVKYPNYRGYVWEDREQEIKGVVEVNAPEGTNISDYKVILSFSRVVEGGSPMPVDTVTIDSFIDGTGDFTFYMSPFSNDDEILIATSLRKKTDNSEIATFPNWRIVKRAASHRSSMPVYFNKNNKLVTHGKTKFIYGVYDRFSGYRCSGCLFTSKERYLNEIKGFDGLGTIENYQDTKNNAVIYFSPMSGANPGYNSTLSNPNDPGTRDPRLDQITPWCEALNDINAGHFQTLHDYHAGKTYRPSWAKSLSDEEMWKVIATYITSKGFLGYYTADEPDLFDGRLTHTQGWNIYDALRQYNHKHPCFAVLYEAGATTNWRFLADILGIDPYPIGRGLRPDDFYYGETAPPYLGQTTLWVKELNDIVFASRPVIAVLQLWVQRGEYPSYEDLKKMAWKSIIAGADGILWWGFVSAMGMEYKWYGGYKSPCDPEPCDADAYPDFKRISHEIMGIEDALIAEDIPDVVTCSNSRIAFIVRRGTHAYYVLATNTTANSINAVTFETTLPLPGTIPVYSESRQITPAGSSRWSDAFLGHDAHVYVIPFLEPMEPVKNLRFIPSN